MFFFFSDNPTFSGSPHVPRDRLLQRCERKMYAPQSDERNHRIRRLHPQFRHSHPLDRREPYRVRLCQDGFVQEQTLKLESFVTYFYNAIKFI